MIIAPGLIREQPRSKIEIAFVMDSFGALCDLGQTRLLNRKAPGRRSRGTAMVAEQATGSTGRLLENPQQGNKDYQGRND
jgi:hypothetical protein